MTTVVCVLKKKKSEFPALLGCVRFLAAAVIKVLITRGLPTSASGRLKDSGRGPWKRPINGLQGGGGGRLRSDRVTHRLSPVNHRKLNRLRRRDSKSNAVIFHSFKNGSRLQRRYRSNSPPVISGVIDSRHERRRSRSETTPRPKRMF